MGTSTQAGVPATHVMKAVALLLLPLAAARPDTGFTAFHPQATHSVHGSNVPVHHTHGAVHGVHHAAPLVHHSVHTPHHHSTIFRGQLPVSVHSHQVHVAAVQPVAAPAPAVEEAVEEAVVKAVVEEAIEEVAVEAAVEEAIAEVADAAEVVDLRTPEKTSEPKPAVTTFVHTAPVVHHVTPVVHHSAPVVHHSAPVVHHAAPVVHSHQVHG